MCRQRSMDLVRPVAHVEAQVGSRWSLAQTLFAVRCPPAACRLPLVTRYCQPVQQMLASLGPHVYICADKRLDNGHLAQRAPRTRVASSA